MRAQQSRFVHFLYPFYVFLVIVLFACGQSEDEESNLLEGKTSLTSKDCGAVANPIEGRLGTGVHFLLKPPGGVAPFAWRSAGSEYEGDSSGGLTFASDTNPIARANFKAIAEKGNAQSFYFTYQVKQEMANQETRYASQYPGAVTEIIKMTDAQGKNFSCRLTTRLSP